MNYRNLEVWQLARALVIAIHEMTLSKLPKFEMFEEGTRIQRAIKSVKSNIVEGYGRRCHKQEFLRFVDYALAWCDETADHLDTLVATKSLTDASIIDLFLQSVERSHQLEK